MKKRLRKEIKYMLQLLGVCLVFLMGFTTGKLLDNPKEVVVKRIITEVQPNISLTNIELDNFAPKEVIAEEIKEEFKEETTEEAKEEFVPQFIQTESLYSINDLEYHGVINWEGYKFTFYSERVLPGQALYIPGRYTDDYVRDENGYIVLASNYDIETGTIIDTPFGSKGKVYDRCPECTMNWFDVYTR